MGRIKVHRQNINNLIQSVSSKSIYQWLVIQTRTRFGVALQEAHVIAEKAEILITEKWNILTENQFYLQLPSKNANHKKRSKDQLSYTPAKLTAFDHSDLELYQQYGLKAMQNSRIVRFIEEAYCQDTLFSYTELCLLTQTTAKSIRERMIPLWNLGIRLPINGMGKKYRDHHLFRSTFALQEHFSGISLTHLQSTLFFSNSLWRTWQCQFIQIIQKNQEGSNPTSIAELLRLPLELVTEYINLALSLKDNSRYHEFISTYQNYTSLTNQKGKHFDCNQHFIFDLEINHNFSKAKSRLYLNMLRELRDQTLQISRKPNEVIYYAISSNESPGKALSECQLNPVQIPWWTDEDFQVLNLDSTRNLKWQKIMRFSSKVHNQGACLNQSDLAFLLGVHPAVIQKQMKSHNSILLPTRGNVADIGPGMTHIEKILELFLQGYTETEIVRRTGHSYSSIENYISMFSRVVSLLERSMPLPLIRQTLGCSMKLVKKHVSIYNRYNTPDYQFMLMQVRRIFDNLSTKNNSKKNEPIPTRRSIWDDQK